MDDFEELENILNEVTSLKYDDDKEQSHYFINCIKAMYEHSIGDFRKAHKSAEQNIEFAKRLGIVEVRYMRIINEFIEKEKDVNDFIQNSSLSNKALEIFTLNFKSKTKRLS